MVREQDELDFFIVGATCGPETAFRAKIGARGHPQQMRELVPCDKTNTQARRRIEEDRSGHGPAYDQGSEGARFARLNWQRKRQSQRIDPRLTALAASME